MSLPVTWARRARVAHRGLRRLLWALAIRRVPEMLCLALGFIAVGTGSIFLSLNTSAPTRLRAYGSVFEYFSPFQWGIACFGLGVAITTAGLINRAKAPLVCSALGLVYVAMGILSIPSVVRGESVGMIFVVGVGVGSLAWVTMLACLAPVVRR